MPSYALQGLGNCHCKLVVGAGADGEAYNLHNNETSIGAIAVTTSVLCTIAATTLTTATVGDHCRAWFYRDAVNAGDTVGDIVYFVGFLVSYTADS